MRRATLPTIVAIALAAGACGAPELSRSGRSALPTTADGPKTAETPAAVSANSLGSWTPTEPMHTGREAHTATRLPGGTVLIAGGNTASAELYDPTTGAWAATGDMLESRVSHTATLLADGRVLIVGGTSEEIGADGTGDITPKAAAELYDPATGSWTSTGSLVEPRGAGHTATLLPDGRVLIAGGYQGTRMTAAAELYDPATGSWTATASMTSPRIFHAATLLLSGEVLVAGSVSGSATAELYDAESGTWTETGSMVRGRHDFTATLLQDGTVLAAAYEGSRITELYDPATGTWTESGPMLDVRLGRYTATLLPDGTVLAAGGVPNRHTIVEVYDPDTAKWERGPDTHGDRHHHSATLLQDGTVLVAGGRGLSASAEIFEPRASP